MAPVDPPAMTFGSLFAGIGGFDLGLERAGMVCKWQVEIDLFCRKVLTKHWPHVPKFEDVREVGAHNLDPVDLLCGGFPCQDISVAGKMSGIDGARSGLWSEYARIIDELRPRYALVENVAALLGWGLGRVLGDLAEIGYDAEWECLPASAFGAHHRRDRVWILAYPSSVGLGGRVSHREAANARTGSAVARDGVFLADSTSERQQGSRQSIIWCDTTSDAEGETINALASGVQSEWGVEPELGRVAHGISNRMERLTALGNAIVPQIAEWLGRRILEAVQ